jgi:hypothetical protein
MWRLDRPNVLGLCLRPGPRQPLRSCFIVESIVWDIRICVYFLRDYQTRGMNRLYGIYLDILLFIKSSLSRPNLAGILLTPCKLISTSEAPRRARRTRPRLTACAGANVNVSTHPSQARTQLGPALDLSLKIDCPFWNLTVQMGNSGSDRSSNRW